VKKILLIFFLFSLGAETQAKVIKDTTVYFKVRGACEMCKERIEETAKIKGVRSASWDVNSKILTLNYTPSNELLPKINKRIAEVGHDTELEKAKDAIYNALPACCYYREIDKIIDHEVGDTLLIRSYDSLSKLIKEKLDVPSISPHTIKGVVLEENKKGTFNPLIGASVL